MNNTPNSKKQASIRLAPPSHPNPLSPSGVLWRGGVAIPGASAGIAALRAAGKRVLFVSNNSTKTRAQTVAQLSSVGGIPATLDDVVSSAYAAALYCVSRGFTKKVYVVGQSGLIDELTAAGLTVLGPEDGVSAPAFTFGQLTPGHLDPDVQAVVAGFDGHLTYKKMAMAVSHLRYTPGCAFVATNRDATFPDAHMLVPGGGCVIAALVTGSGREPDVVAGKPDPSLLTLLEGACGVVRGRTCMIGDRIDTDIAWGREGGLSTLCVLTGITTPSLLEKMGPSHPHAPHHVTGSLADVATLLGQ